MEPDAPTEFTITPSAGANGSITPDTVQTVTSGADSVTFAITPDANCHVTDVLVDGVSVGALTSYQFTNVTADHTISATFATDTYTVTTSAGAGGSVSPVSPVVAHGSDVSFLITPDAHFHIADVAIDGASQGPIASYTFTNVTAEGPRSRPRSPPTPTTSPRSPGPAAPSRPPG